jgi:hypothetical protein
MEQMRKNHQGAEIRTKRKTQLCCASVKCESEAKTYLLTKAIMIFCPQNLHHILAWNVSGGSSEIKLVSALSTTGNCHTHGGRQLSRKCAR